MFIDETWAKANMTCSHGWAARGKRLVGKTPHGHWNTITFLAALRHDRIDARCLFDGPSNGELFRVYVAQVLLVTLAPGDVVILDNLGGPKSKAVRNAIRATGAKLIFLPKYALISTRSNRPSPGPRHCCVKLPSEASRPHGKHRHCLHTLAPSPGSAPITPPTQVTLQRKTINALRR